MSLPGIICLLLQPPLTDATGLLSAAQPGRAPARVTTRPHRVVPPKTLYFNGYALASILSQMMDGHVKYSPGHGRTAGSKAPRLSCDPGEISYIDCSGFVRYLFFQLCGLRIPDGSSQQIDWCRKYPFQAVDYRSEAPLLDDTMRIAHLAASGAGHHGHIWFVLNGKTIESHGAHDGRSGPDRRTWNNSHLIGDVDRCYKLGPTFLPELKLKPSNIAYA